MNTHPRTEEAYERANHWIESTRNERLRDAVERDELDKECQKMEDEIYRLRTALGPFAKFACDEPHVGEPPCHNCVAKAALAPASPNNSLAPNGWREIDDSDPSSIPQKMGYYFAASNGGYVDKSFFSPDGKGINNMPSRKSVGKYSRYFELSSRGYKITHWMPLPEAPASSGKGEG